MATANQLLAGYQSATEEIRRRVLEYVSRVWSSSGWFRDAEVDLIVARILPVVQAGQRQVAFLTDSYIGQMAVLAGVTWTPAPLQLDPIVNYRGVDPEVAYRRPAVAVYTALSNGKSFADAVDLGLKRLVSITATDVQQAKNRQAAESLGRTGYRYFRRQLSGSENCALCAIASTQRYTRGDLMPIHGGCDCVVVPMMARRDPGQVIDAELLATVHQEVERFVGISDRGGRVPDYRNLIVTNTHGELGPTLGWRGDKFTGPEDIPAVLS